MSFTSPVFYLFLLITVLAYQAPARPPIRQAVLFVASVVFIRSYATSWLDLTPLALFIAAGYALIRLVVWSKSLAVLPLSVIAYVALFIHLKKVIVLSDPLLGFDYAVIGMSYILFRTLHLIIDCSTGEVETPPSFWMFVLYATNFLCFVSGPIQLWGDFEKTDFSGTVAIARSTAFTAFSRISLGLFKLAVVAATANYLFDNISVQIVGGSAATTPTTEIIKYTVTAMAYTAYLYFNFAGYMDIVIGAGLLLGQEVPENFKSPFAARSFLEFWQRWHITLSLWFKAYVFTPLLMALMGRWNLANWPASVGVFCFFVTFLLMGVWHGTTSIFVVYGLMMGLGASINKIWSLALQKTLGLSSYRRMSDNLFYGSLCRGLTFAYFTLALTCLWIGDVPHLMALIGRVGLLGIPAALVIMTFFFAAAFPLYEGARKLLSALADGRVGTSDVALNFAVAVRIVGVIFVIGLLNKTPEFVYKAF